MQYDKPKVYWLTLIAVIFSILNISTSYAAPSCPNDDKMYYVGDSPPSGSTSMALSWTAGNTSNTFSFTEGSINIILTLTFSNVKNLSPNGNPPFYGNVSGLSTNAINMRHTSQTADVNHTLSAAINRPVTKFGFVVQDLDTNQQAGYVETLNLDTAGGSFSNINTSKISLVNNGQKAQGITWQNCNYTTTTDNCDFNIDWGSQTQNTPFSVSHGNSYSPGTNSTHVVAYKNFYFCVTPPKLTTKKVLTGNRVETNDQFTIATTTGTTSVSRFTTTGTGNSLTTNSITARGLSTTATYTIAETIANTDGKGNLANYNTSYACTNANSSSATTMPSGSTTSFNLPILTYGDDITCTITNMPSAYIFSGIIFNDNGGIASDLNNPATNTYPTTAPNANYFNGKYDPTANEKGIYQTGLQVQLAKNCNTTSPTPIKTVPVNTDGTYSITATQTDMAGATNVCLIEKEPGGNLTTYPVDTTNNQLNINYVATTYNYPNLNFGEVSQNNAGLVLVKEQATNDCNITNTAMLGLTYNAVTQSGIDARKCVAYKITAYNRTNLTNPLTNVRITDALPKKGVNTSTVTSTLVGPTDTTSNNFNINFNSGVTGAVTAFGQNGTVVSNVKSLDKGASMSLYFNTKYDSSLP